MQRLSRRTKIVSIRLSQEEYTRLQGLVAARGVENLSELARTAMNHLLFQEHVNGYVGDGGIETRVNQMHARMSILDREVARLSDLMGVERLKEA